MAPSAGMALAREQLREMCGTNAGPNDPAAAPRHCSRADEPATSQLRNLRQRLAGRQPHDFIWDFVR